MLIFKLYGFGSTFRNRNMLTVVRFQCANREWADKRHSVLLRKMKVFIREDC